MSLGSQLQAAREGKHLSTSEVAAATRSKVQIIEAIERDDYSVFSAPVYGKGFIRLYAQVVGLEPQPLVDEYLAVTRKARAPSLVSDGGVAPAPRAPTPAADSAAPVKTEGTAPAGRPARADSFDLFNAAEARASASAGERASPPPKESRPASAAGELLREVTIRWWHALRDSVQLGKTSAAGMRADKDPWKAVPVVIGIVIILVFVASGLSRCARRPGGSSAWPAHGSGDIRLAADVPEPYFD